MSGSYRLKAAKGSPVETILAGEPKAAPARKGPSLVFSIGFIAGVALVTAGGVAVFFAKPSQGAPETAPMAAKADEPVEAETPIEADKPVMTASLDPAFPPVRKVVTTQVAALKGPAVMLPSPKPPRTKLARSMASSVQIADAAEFDALEQQDPRWARSGADHSDAVFASVLQPGAGGAAVALGGTVPADGDRSAAKADDSSDDTRTAAIAPDEAKSSAKREDKSDDAVADEAPSSPPAAGESTRNVQINRGANMRSRPKSGSRTLMVVPGRATVQLVGSCKSWCEVIYKGQRGYIYKDFVGGSSKRAASARSTRTTKAAAAKPKVKSVYVVGQTDKPAADTAQPAVQAAQEEKRFKFSSERLQR